MTRIALAAALCAACYQQPSLASCKYQCGGANNDACPNGYSCNAGMCVAAGESCDGDGGVIDAPPPDDAADDAIDASTRCGPAFTLNLRDALETETSLSQIVALDVTNDGVLDLVALDEINNIGVYVGMGTGTFVATPVRPSIPSTGKRLLVGDWDGDTKQDDLTALSTNTNGSLTILQSSGSANLVPSSMGLDPNGPVDIAYLGSVDGDNRADLAVLYTNGSGSVKVMRQNSSGVGFSPGSSKGSIVGTALAAGQINGDSDIDVAVLAPTGFVVHAGDGNGGFDAAMPLTSISGTPVDVVIGQVHAAGGPSIVTANSLNDTVSIRQWQGVGADPSVGAKPVAVILTDLTGDLLPEIVTANNVGDGVSVLINTGGAVWTQPITTMVGDAPVDVISADFDGDDRMDLAVATRGDSMIRVYLNKCVP